MDSLISMALSLLYIIVITYVCSSVYGSYFNPNVTVKVCSSAKLVVRVTDAVSGGIIYIQGKGSACKQTTDKEPRDYHFDIERCSIDFDTTFRIVVQERADIQTGLDKVIPVMCILDLSAIKVGNHFIPVSPTNEGQNKTVKPTASLKILLNNTDVSGGSVTLSDPLNMKLELDDQFKDDFDIKAKDCSAAFKTIVDDGCAPDRDLFPDFDRTKKGTLVANFNAFQPTDLKGETEADIAYTCTVAVCKGSCERTVCETIVGWGRKRRDSENINEVERLTLGTTLKVLSPVQMQSHKGKEEWGGICIEKITLFAVGTLTFVIVLASLTLSGYLMKRLHRTVGPPETSMVERAKAAGRRLSAMLNIPTTYDLKAKDQSYFQQIPEEESSPEQVRKPVHVVNVAYKEDY